MSKSDTLENAILDLLFNGTTIPDLAEDDTTSPATTITVALHTASPTDSGDMTANEATYTSYVRKTVARTSGGWTITGNSASPVANIEFAAATGGSETITYFSVGTGVSDNVMYYGTVTPNIVVTSGVTPILTTASTVTED